MTLLKALSAAVLGVALAATPTLAVHAADDPTPVPTASATPVEVVPNVPDRTAIRETCVAARGLMGTDPQAALDLIDALRAAAGNGSSPYLDEIRFACERTRLQALATLAESKKPDPKSDAQKFGEGWDDFVEAWISPLATSAGAAAGLFFGLLLVGRLLALAPRIRDGITVESARRPALGLSALLIGAASAGLVALFANFARFESGDARLWAGVALLSIAASVGVIYFALSLAGRLKIAVDVEENGEASAWAKAEVVNLLYKFGAAPPAGTDIPASGDLTALADGALPPAVAPALWQHIQAGIKFVFLGTPWRFKIETDSQTHAIVSVQHNGVSLKKTDITLRSLRLPEGTDAGDALRVYASAVIISVLAQNHRGFEELMGARAWRSLGALYMANLLTDKKAKVALWKESHALDQRNRPAQLAITHSEARRANKVTVLKPWVNWLRNEVTIVASLPRVHRGVPLDYELRIRRLQAIGESNLRQARVQNNDTTEGWEKYNADRVAGLDNLTVLADALVDDSALDGLHLRDQFRMDTALLLAEATESREEPAWYPIFTEWYDDAQNSEQPLVAYNFACHLARLERQRAHEAGTAAVASTPGTPEVMRARFAAQLEAAVSGSASEIAAPDPSTSDAAALFAKIQDSLRIAFQQQDLKEWSLTDPDFAALRTLPEFIQLGATPPRSNMWELDEFADLKEKAVEAGFAAATDLVELGDGIDKDTAKYFDQARLVLKNRVELAGFVKLATTAAEVDDGVKVVLVELVADLFGAGVTSVSDLTAEWLEVGTATQLPKHPLLKSIKRVRREFQADIELREATQWLNRIADPRYTPSD